MLKQEKTAGYTECGAYFITFVMLLGILVGALGLVADLSRAYRVTRVMQRSVDLGALAGMAIRAEYGPGLNDISPGGGTYQANYVNTACRTVAANATLAGLDVEATFSTGATAPDFFTMCANATTVQMGGGNTPPSINISFSDNNSLPFAMGFAATAKMLGNFDFSAFNIRAVGRAQLNRAAVALVLDYSGSMNCPNTDSACECVTSGGCGTQNLKIDILRDAAQEFVNRFTNSWDRVSLIPFNSRGVVAWPLSEELDKEQINARLTNYKAGGGTNLSHALYLANTEFSDGNFNKFQQQTGRFERSIVVFSDGAPTSAVVRPELDVITTNRSNNAKTTEGFLTSQLNLIAQSGNKDNTVSFKFSAPGPLVRLSSISCAKFSKSPPCNSNEFPPDTEVTGGKVPFAWKTQLPPGVSFTTHPPYAPDQVGYVHDPTSKDNQKIMPLCSTTRGTGRIPSSIDTIEYGDMAREVWQNNWTQLANWPGPVAPGQTAWFCLNDAAANTITDTIGSYAKFNALESMGQSGLLPGGLSARRIRHSVYTTIKPRHRPSTGGLQTNGDGTIASPVIARHFEEMYFNAALAEADAIMSKNIGIYTIGLGQPADRFVTSTGGGDNSLTYTKDKQYFRGEQAPGAAGQVYELNATHPDKSPYQLPEDISKRDFGLRYDYFLARLSNDRMARDYTYKHQCLRKNKCRMDRDFNSGTNDSIEPDAYERRFNGMIADWDAVWGDETQNLYKRGWYQAATSDHSLSELFARIARRILLRGIS